MNKIIILVVSIVIIIGIILIFEYIQQNVPFEEKSDVPQEPVYSQPMNTSISTKSQEFKINLPVSSGLIAWEGVCLVDEDCTYVQNPPGSTIPECINLNHTQATYDLITNENIHCVCEPLIMEVPITEENISVWVEDQGSIVCQIKENKPDLAIQKFEIIPQNPTVNERVIYNTTIKNIGTSGCSMINTIINFGGGAWGLIKMSWCTHYGYTPEECRQMDSEPYFNPGETVNPLIDWRYNASGTYNVTVLTMCQQTELDYSNNNDNKIIQVS